ncbi:MAG TPA: permease [Armatimonadota bacterium]|jgi:hypothetical protein
MTRKDAPKCECAAEPTPAAGTPDPRAARRKVLLLAAGLVLWVVVYHLLQPGTAWVACTALCGRSSNAFKESVAFFLYDVPKVLLLLTLIVFGVGVLRSFFTAERTRQVLAGKRESLGNVLAAALGIVTPFCSCSAVPLFIGFVTAGVPLGVTFSFLIAAPMINEVAVVLLFGLFGWQVAALYTGTGLVIAILAGWVIGRLHLEKWVEPWVYELTPGEAGTQTAPLTWNDRLDFGLQSVREIVGKVWPWVVVGIAVGAAIHGYVPENFMAAIMGRGAWWSVPVAVVLGIPMYSNAAGIIPVVQALLEKGAALGTVLAFMMAVIGLSLPETILLRQVLRPRLIAVFLGVVGLGIILVGYLFNALM